MDIPSYFHIPFEPIADPAAVVQTAQARFTVLKPRLLRLEYSPDGRFEDRPSQAFWFRRQPVPEYRVRRLDGWLILETDALRLEYDPAAGAFSPHSLRITVKATGARYTYGDAPLDNLLGTARTLDEANGRVELGQGLNSRAGWSLVDDSQALVFSPEGWLEPRRAAEGTLDLYFFGYGHAYQDCIREFQDVSGRTPLLPRWALGNWWSRYWKYSAADLLGLMVDFLEYRIPLAVCIVDMDWHLTETGSAASGWTGYTWNRELFPDPVGFIAGLHRLGLRTALNLHPADGVWPHEEAYPAMARAVGIDPASRRAVAFDIAEPTFARAYFDLLHHPLEQQGVDFWWIDWQQGEQTRLDGLDPLWWLNHLHFYDLGRPGAGKRPFIFSRWGGLGNHRYPIGFSGDTMVSWESLAFQPYFTATAANVGYGWWSHDIGGHFRGREDRQLYTRWVQFGVFSPIFRLHSTNDPYLDRRPWAFDETVLNITRRYLRLRHALIPYLYSLSRRNQLHGDPPITPMYFTDPQAEEAYHCPHQYRLGEDILAAPVTCPLDPDLQRAPWGVWLPAGDWFDFFTGERRPGGGWTALYPALEETPLFARAGAIVPLKVDDGDLTPDLPEELEVRVYPGADGQFELYEDDGVSDAYQSGAWRTTRFEQCWQPRHLVITVRAASGDLTVGPAGRTYRFKIFGLARPVAINLTRDGKNLFVGSKWSEEAGTLELDPISVPVNAELRIVLVADGESLLDTRDARRRPLEGLIRSMRAPTYVKARLHAALDEILDDPRRLERYLPALTTSQAQALASLAGDVGYLRLPYSADQARIVLWNRRSHPGFTYRLISLREMYAGADGFEGGVVPAFKVIFPDEIASQVNTDSRLEVDFFGLERERLL